MGYGVVGQACAAMLSSKGHLPIPWDPPKGLTKVDPAEVEVAFICVPAPTVWQTGEVDVEAIRDCLSRLRYGSIAIIRSTVPPGTTDTLRAEALGKNVFFVPEFLTEATAEQDALNPTRVLVGLPDQDRSDSRACAVVCDLVRPPTGVPMMLTSARSAEMAKYVANAFYALKVAFFNEAFDIAERNGANWREVMWSVRSDPWTGAQHTDVHHGGYRGYGGKCLPKDVHAFAAHARTLGFPMLTVEAAEVVNGELQQRQEKRGK